MQKGPQKPIDLYQFWRELDTKPLLDLFPQAVSGEDKRGRERNSNDSIGQKLEHSNMEEVFAYEIYLFLFFI